MPRKTVWIIRNVTFAEQVDAGHPAVRAARAGRPVDPGTLPASLLGREPSAVAGSTWFTLDDSRPTEIRLTRS